jgi:hypothetical protein
MKNLFPALSGFCGQKKKIFTKFKISFTTKAKYPPFPFTQPPPKDWD